MADQTMAHASTPSPRLRPPLSIAMPAHEFPHQLGLPLPKTPEPLEDVPSHNEPPPRPQRETYPTYKIKRKRRGMAHDALGLPEVPVDCEAGVIPTIETSEIVSEMSSPVLRPSSEMQGLLSPLPSFQRLFTPPATPAAQVRIAFGHLMESTYCSLSYELIILSPQIDPSLDQSDSLHNEWQLIREGRTAKSGFERSGSVCSSFSDSSVSSYGSSALSGPNIGSCTSPISEATTDPFMEEESPTKPASLPPDYGSPSAKRVKRFRGVKWTPEMDKHLEATYVRYLQDPCVTPFKTLPGVPPPLGVCSRVASKARHTWSSSRSATPSHLDTILEYGKFVRQGSPDTIRPESEINSLANRPRQQQPPWPRSDGQTRRRLRHIVKRKPALSAYYQRLLHSRSVSPFSSSAPGSASQIQPSPAPFSSRDLTISLVTSTAPAMQPEGPLAQLTSQDMSDKLDREQSSPRPTTARPADWFARIGRSQAHQKSMSLQSHLNLAPPPQPSSSRLASPFDDKSHRSRLLRSMGTTKSLGRKDFLDLPKPSLAPPFEGAPTAPRSLKRRFKSDEEKPRRPGLEDVFGPPSEEDANAVRSRGFSLGAVRATDSLTKLFDPPSAIPPVPALAFPGPSTPVPSLNLPEQSTPLASIDHEMTEAPEIPAGCRSAPRRFAEPIPRLGSPFVEIMAPGRMSNTFPRRYVPSPSNPQPFQDHLRELAARNLQK